MAKNQLTRILQSPDKDIQRTSGPNGVLARMFRQMLADLNININRWSSLMQDFITDIRNGVPNNKKDQTSMRGNLTKEFARPQMTWKVFCKAMRFLQVRRIELVIKAHHENGKTSLHSTAVDFGTRKSNIHDLFDAIDHVDPDEPEEKDDEVGGNNNTPPPPIQ